MSAVASHVVPPRSKLDSILSSGLEHNIEQDPLEVWDKGVFINELLKQGIALSTNAYGTLDGDLVADEGLKKGTYKGTRLALTEIYSILEDAYATLKSRNLPQPANNIIVLCPILTSAALSPSFLFREISISRSISISGVMGVMVIPLT
jgi:hypothetical protein